MSKIIVTIGPASIAVDTLIKLAESGAKSFRINLSHSDKKSLDFYFKRIISAGIVPSVDTQGAQLRIEGFSENINCKNGDIIDLNFGSIRDDIKPAGRYISFNHPEVSAQISPGDILKIDFDGLLVKAISSSSEYTWKGVVIAEGKIVLNRAVDVQGKVVALSPLTSFDKYALKYSQENGCNEVYASFVSTAADVAEVRKYLDPNVRLISKIESALGVANALEIIKSSDAILIDRGDLSREISIPSIPMAVMSIVDLAQSQDCPVYVATNILDSMMNPNLPSRAEISDIYTLLNSGVSGLVLAAEVAIGQNPISSTSLISYLIKLYQAHRQGLYGIADVPKPNRNLVGEQLYGWL